MTHQFDIEDAKKYGVNAAVILSNIRFWIAKNKANGKHFHNGKTWTFNSVSAFQKLFPYLSDKQIRTALGKLKRAGEIEAGNFNASPYDRTSWYCLKVEFDLPKKANGNCETGKSTSTDNKPDKKTHYEKGDSPEILIFQEYPKRVGKNSALRAIKKALKTESFDYLLSKTKDYAKARIGQDPQFTPYPATWFNDDRYNDDHSTWAPIQDHRPQKPQAERCL